jgi:hypothetical protein
MTKMKTLDWKDVVQLHIDKFGVEPVITGINFHDSDKIIIWVMEAIENGTPYIEKDVPDGIDI